jgi:branched-chain amino acid transport system permease protein
MRNPWAQTGNYRTSYRQDTSIFATHRELVSLLLFLGFLLLLPQFLSRTQVFILDLILVYSVAVLGLNITTGYAGLINIGQAAFMGVGAYTAALLAPMGLPFWLLILLGGLVAAFFGFLVGIPSLRVKHLYLALATLAFQIIFEWTVGHLPPPEARAGPWTCPGPASWAYEAGFRNHFHFWYYVSLATLVVLALFWRNLLRTRYGRALVAVRDNDRAADAMGMDPGRTKLFAFALGAFYAGVAGVLYAYLSRAVVIEDYVFAHSVKLPGHGHRGRARHPGGELPGAGLPGASGREHGGALQPGQGLGLQRGRGGRGQRPQALRLWPGDRPLPHV